MTDAPLPTPPAPHIAPARGVGTIMRLVIAATVPAGIVHVAVFGPGLVVQLALCVTTCVAVEALCVHLRGRDPRHALGDWSAVLCGVLIAFSLPSLAPWYVAVCASVTAIGVAKHAFGGLGANVFNPAMAGYALAVLAFPEGMTRWPGTDVAWSQVAAIFTGQAPFDALTMATPLDQVRSGLGQMRMMSEILAGDAMTGRGAWWAFQGATLVGGVALLGLKVIRWQLPVATLLGAVICAGVLHVIDADRFASAAFHLGTGGLVFAAFFIVTDPVTAATSPRGRLVYGAAIGALAVALRAFGAYPDGVAFAVLLLNACVPLIDRVTRPRAYGVAASPAADDAL